MGRSRGFRRIFRPLEKLTRGTFDLLDPIIDLDGSRTKKLMQKQFEQEKQMMEQAENREKELLTQAQEKAKFEDRIANERRDLANRVDGLDYSSGDRSKIGQASGSTALANAIKKSEILKGDKQNNSVITQADEVEDLMRKYLKK